MRKAGNYALAASSLLLAGCSVPTSVEELTGWRDWFFISIDFDTVMTWLNSPDFSLVRILSTMALLLTMYGAIQNLARQRMMFSGNGVLGLGVMAAIPVLVWHFEITSHYGRMAFPPNLNVDRVLSVLQLELTTDVTKIALSAYAIGLVLAIPQIHAMWQIAMLPKAIGSTIESVAGRTWNGLYKILIQTLSWMLFPWFFYILVEVLEKVSATTIASNKWALYGGFTFLVVVLMWLCYKQIPDSVESKFIHKVIVEESDNTESKSRMPKIDSDLIWQLLLLLGLLRGERATQNAPTSPPPSYGGWSEPPKPMLPLGPKGPVNGGGSGKDGRSPSNVVDAEWKESTRSNEPQKGGTSDTPSNDPDSLE